MTPPGTEKNRRTGPVPFRPRLVSEQVRT